MSGAGGLSFRNMIMESLGKVIKCNSV